MVDWSGAATPGPRKPSSDQIWIGWCDTTSNPSTVSSKIATSGPPLEVGEETIFLRYCRTRAEAIEIIADLCRETNGPVIAGFDFPFGYPADSGLGGGRACAAMLANLVEGAPNNANNRGEVAGALNTRIAAAKPDLDWSGGGPFWGYIGKSAPKTLPRKKPKPLFDRATDAWLSEWRQVERFLRARKQRPFTCWQMGGAGSVGSQALLGLAQLHHLVGRLEPEKTCRFWPFETDWDQAIKTPGKTDVIIAEIWPSAKTSADVHPFEHVSHAIKDAQQVAAVCARLADAQRTGTLAKLFAAPPLPDADLDEIIKHEGWIVGASEIG